MMKQITKERLVNYSNFRVWLEQVTYKKKQLKDKVKTTATLNTKMQNIFRKYKDAREEWLQAREEVEDLRIEIIEMIPAENK